MLLQNSHRGVGSVLMFFTISELWKDMITFACSLLC